MKWFINHKIIEDQDGYIVELYLDQQLSEFAKEFLETHKKDTGSFEKYVSDYIKEKIPNVKVKTVKIMLGSLLLTSIPFSSIHAETSSIANTNQVQNQTFAPYTVQSGDTLFGISRKFDTTVDQLKSINGLTSNLIYKGQLLKIPNMQPTIYIVQKEDTLFKISKQYNVSLEQLKAVNGLTGDALYIGQTLTIPNGDITVPVSVLPNVVLNVGARGEDVKKIQKALNDLGYSLSPDGIYGSRTKAAILDFQKQHAALTNDGVYGPKTKEYLQQTLLNNKDAIISNPRDVLVLVNKNNRLPSTYIPENVVVPNVSFSFKDYNPKKLMRQDGASALEEMFEQTKQENITLYAVSGYRSYDRQKAIFASNVEKYGMEIANQFSAKPGESEHQTGLAMDITSATANFKLTEYFGATKEGKWVKENAHKFGFIIRYEKGKEHITRYQYEPWHLRYIGKDAAKEITNQNITLEEYLGKK
ncbi:D-alanyl-D-alanine carboxypeptidase family protein [Lutibacter sp. B2]|nr:D-alanyl-D-alanine carboxypeptidase family protein [Lutibacter sp. B2]